MHKIILAGVCGFGFLCEPIAAIAMYLDALGMFR